CAKAARLLSRSLLYARDEVLVYAREATTERASGPPRLEITRGSLAELALMQADYPDYINAGFLQVAHQRLRRGDELHVARRGGKLAHLAWVGKRREI